MLLKRPSNKFVIGSTNHNCNFLVIFAGINISLKLILKKSWFMALNICRRDCGTDNTKQFQFLEFNSWEDSTLVAPLG